MSQRNPTFPDDYYTTVERLTDEYEGGKFHAYQPNAAHFECDWCSKGVAYKSKPRVGHYMADRVLNPTTPKAKQVNRQRRLAPLATYCEECTSYNLLFPCKGFTEVRLLFDLDENMVMQNVDVTDISAEDDGIPWDPRELSEKITRVPFTENALFAGLDHIWGPENIVTVFLSIGAEIDIRELVKWDGSLDPQLLGQSRRKYQDFREKMGQHGHDRRAFRDHVRDREP